MTKWVTCEIVVATAVLGLAGCASNLTNNKIDQIPQPHTPQPIDVLGGNEDMSSQEFAVDKTVTTPTRVLSEIETDPIREKLLVQNVYVDYVMASEPVIFENVDNLRLAWILGSVPVGDVNMPIVSPALIYGNGNIQLVDHEVDPSSRMIHTDINNTIYEYNANELIINPVDLGDERITRDSVVSGWSSLAKGDRNEIWTQFKMGEVTLGNFNQQQVNLLTSVLVNPHLNITIDTGDEVTAYALNKWANQPYKIDIVGDIAYDKLQLREGSMVEATGAFAVSLNDSTQPLSSKNKYEFGNGLLLIGNSTPIELGQVNEGDQITVRRLYKQFAQVDVNGQVEILTPKQDGVRINWFDSDNNWVFTQINASTNTTEALYVVGTPSPDSDSVESAVVPIKGLNVEFPQVVEINVPVPFFKTEGLNLVNEGDRIAYENLDKTRVYELKEGIWVKKLSVDIDGTFAFDTSFETEQQGVGLGVRIQSVHYSLDNIKVRDTFNGMDGEQVIANFAYRMYFKKAIETNPHVREIANRYTTGNNLDFEPAFAEFMALVAQAQSSGDWTNVQPMVDAINIGSRGFGGPNEPIPLRLEDARFVFFQDAVRKHTDDVLDGERIGRLGGVDILDLDSVERYSGSSKHDDYVHFGVHVGGIESDNSGVYATELVLYVPINWWSIHTTDDINEPSLLGSATYYAFNQFLCPGKTLSIPNSDQMFPLVNSLGSKMDQEYTSVFSR